ncbi:MAG TPA: DUF6311 domain-containing protein [Kofleriaceae bacterium]
MRHRRLLIWLLAIAVGSTVFFVWMGYARTLDPRDLGWIFHEDPFAHEMGWEQYRNAPLLQYPITKNTLYGLEWGSTIVFTDSIPIVALVLRPLSDLLPRPCQYDGWWVLLSLVLQAYWAARLVLLRSDRLGDAALGCIFFVTAPVLVERLGLQTGVGSHWLLLWALWLYFGSRGPATRSWAVLLLLTVSVHAYLFVMVSAIWIAHLVSQRLQGQLPPRAIVLAGGVVIAVIAWMHALGYFMVGDGAAGGTWRSSFDLLGFVSPCAGAWFDLVPVMYNDPWDGTSYLGAGALALLIASTAARVATRRSPALSGGGPRVPWAPLLAAVVGLGAFALTNHITFAHKLIGRYPLPPGFSGLYDTFRGAARMIWPAYYLVLLATLWLALRAWPQRWRTLVIALAAALQLVDLTGVGAAKRGQIQGDGLIRPLRDPIWAVIAQHYRSIISVPAYHRQADWPTFAWFAARNRLGSDIAYSSRNNPAVRQAGTRAHLDAVASGHYDPQTVYYFPSSDLWTVARGTMGPQDLAVVADGYHLVLPGGRAWVAAAPPAAPPGVPRLGTWIPFSPSDATGLLVDGWSWPEKWGTWSIEPLPSLVLPVPPNERVRVSFQWQVAGLPQQARTMCVFLDDEMFPVRFLRRYFRQKNSFEVTTRGPLLTVRLGFTDLTPHNPNSRAAEVGILAARVERADQLSADEVPAAATAPAVLDDWISFAAHAPGRAFLGDGWSWGEVWGTWSDYPAPELALPVPPGERLAVSFRWLATAPQHQVQSVRVVIDDRPFLIQFPTALQDQESTFEVTSRRPWIAVRLEIDRPVLSRGRELGIGLKAARVHRIAGPGRE